MMPTFLWGPNWSFFGLAPWILDHGLAKLANILSTSMIPFESSISKLSEHHKIVEIGSMEFKLPERLIPTLHSIVTFLVNDLYHISHFRFRYYQPDDDTKDTEDKAAVQR